MKTQLAKVQEEITEHGEITLKPLFPKEWKEVVKHMQVSYPDVKENHNIEVIIPHGLPVALKQNLLGLVQEICYRNQFSIITVSEKDE
jgi:hypothetical protein